MSDESLAGGASAPADSNSAPIDTPDVTAPQPLGTQTPVADKPEPKPEEKPAKSPREAIQRANEKVKAEREAPKTPKETPQATPPRPEKNPDAPVKEGPNRSDDGKFAPKPTEHVQEPRPGGPAPERQDPPQTEPRPADRPEGERKPHHEPPQRFSADAKAAWEAAPDPVKAEVHRAVRELESGIEEHRKRWEPIKEYDDLAKQHGTDLRSALDRYVAFERLINEDPVRGIDSILHDKGLPPLRQLAAHLLNQKPDDVQAQNDHTIRQLNAKIAQLEKQLGGVTTTITQQREQAVTSQVEEFARDHPRFDELAEDVAFFLKSGRTSDLSEAYALAERLNPAPAAASSPAPVSPAPQPRPLNPAGSKSISGAPSAGSDPVGKKKSSIPSIREALNKAVSAA